MGFSAKQVQALERNLDQRHVRIRQANGRELSYIEGWHAISEANRIFGFDGWSRETVDIQCVLARENRGSFLAVYVAKVRITVHAGRSTTVREGHGTGEGRGSSPGEVHDIALKSAETDATKRALATFGKPFGLALYGNGKTTSRVNGVVSRPESAALDHHDRHASLPPDDTTPIPRPSRFYGRRQDLVTRDRAQKLGTIWSMQLSADTSIVPASPSEDRQECFGDCRTQTPSRQSSSKIRSFTSLSGLRPSAVRPASSAICATSSPGPQSQ